MINKSPASTILTILIFFIGAACTGAGGPTQIAGVVRPTVTIKGGEGIGIIADGQTIALTTDYAPKDVVFQWELVGSGVLTNPSAPVTQYVTPTSLAQPEQVIVTVRVTIPNTDLSASDEVIIQLLPLPTPTHILTDIPLSTPPSNATVTSTLPTSASPTTPPKPSSTSTYSGPPTIAIIRPPEGKAHCPIPEPDLCVFKLQGSVGGNIGEMVVRIWVLPINPPGDFVGAHYMQASLITPNVDGAWETNIQIGNFTYPASTGDTLKVIAWLVTPEASNQLDTRVGLATANPENIAQYVAQAEVDLVVDRNP
jgi:hypothetical protein